MLSETGRTLAEKRFTEEKKNRRALKRLFTTHCCSLAPSEQIHRAACRSEGGKIESIAVKVSSVSVLYLTSWVPVRWTVWWLYKKSLLKMATVYSRL